MTSILFKSEEGKKLNSFRTLKWNSSNNLPNTSTKTFWRIRSSVRLFTLLEYLKLKVLVEEIPVDQLRMIYDAPGILKDNLFLSAIMARKSEVPIDILLGRLSWVRNLYGLSPWNLNLFYTLQGIVNFQYEEIRSSIRKVKRYSGYVRNSSSVGSKRMNKVTSQIPEIFEWENSEEIDWTDFLTVGNYFGKFLELRFPDDGPKEVETVSFSSFSTFR